MTNILHPQAPIEGLHSAKTPLTTFGHFLESVAEWLMLIALFGGVLFVLPTVACWLCANF